MSPVPARGAVADFRGPGRIVVGARGQRGTRFVQDGSGGEGDQVARRRAGVVPVRDGGSLEERQVAPVHVDARLGKSERRRLPRASAGMARASSGVAARAFRNERRWAWRPLLWFSRGTCPSLFA